MMSALSALLSATAVAGFHLPSNLPLSPRRTTSEQRHRDSLSGLHSRAALDPALLERPAKRRERLTSFAGALLLAFPLAERTADAAAEDTAEAGSASSLEPSSKDIQTVQEAFKYFDAKDFDRADRFFSRAIDKWESLYRGGRKGGRDELATLYKVRGNVRVDSKRFAEGLEDYNRAIDLMKTDGENDQGIARYQEYPDAFVQRGLTYEGLADWDAAVKDYSKAISLWGGGRGEGINPFVLVFRANALSRLGNYDDALVDYKAADDLFLSLRDDARATDARANFALALYETGRRDDAVKVMRQIVRRQPAYTDMHVALAAHAYSENDLPGALKEWQFACTRIESGCRRYTQLDWVSEIRRWPPSLVSELRSFINDVGGVEDIARKGGKII